MLIEASELVIPKLVKNFLKYWWDEELTIIKEESIAADKLWKSNGKPRSGLIYESRQ